MPTRFHLLRKSELDFEIILRGSQPEDTVDKNRTILKTLAHIEPAISVSYQNEWGKDILKSLSRLRDDIKLLKIDGSSINKQIFEANYSAMDRRFQVSTDMPDYLITIWDLIQDSWQEYSENSSQLFRSLAGSSHANSYENLNDTIIASVNAPSNILLKNEHSAQSLNSGDRVVAGTTVDGSKSVDVLPSSVRSVNLAKLPVSYDGSSCVFDFLERLHELAESRCISNNELLRGIPEVLSGSALLFFRQVKGSVVSWSDFCQQLKQRFQPEDYTYRLSKQIFVRTQGKNETVADYFAVMDTLFSRLTRPMLEEQKLEILLRNVRPVFSNQFGLTDIDSVSKLKSFCSRIEENHKRSKFFCETPSDFLATATCNSNSNSGSSNLDQKSRGSDKVNFKEYSRVNTVYASGPGRPCLRCRTSDHIYAECPRKDEIFCFKCKAPGQKSPSCSNCKLKRQESNHSSTYNSKN